MRNCLRRVLAAIFASLFCLPVLLTAAQAQSATELPPDVLRANQELDRIYLEAHRVVDTKLIMSLFSHGPDVFMIGPTGVFYPSRKDVQRSIESFFAHVESMPGTIDRITYLPAGDGVVAYGQVTYHRKLKGKPPDTTVVVWSDYRRKENGKWVLVHRHAHWPLAGNRERYQKLSAAK
jgi:ketosteroid isomerase-like protein